MSTRQLLCCGFESRSSCVRGATRIARVCDCYCYKTRREAEAEATSMFLLPRPRRLPFLRSPMQGRLSPREMAPPLGQRRVQPRSGSERAERSHATWQLQTASFSFFPRRKILQKSARDRLHPAARANRLHTRKKERGALRRGDEGTTGSGECSLDRHTDMGTDGTTTRPRHGRRSERRT